MRHIVVSHEQWLAARTALLAKEKEFTRLRDALAEQRRQLPWERVEKTYSFDGPDGRETLADLFGARSQLVVYHFMYGPDWEAGCKSCSFWADQYDAMSVHLAQRDVSLVVVARAPLATLQAFRQRMGWRFKFRSSHGSDFNHDYNVSFTPDELAAGKARYNYAPHLGHEMTDWPGVSVFCRDGSTVFHTYSCYARGLDMLNATYQVLDLVPKGRDEADLPHPMSWVRHHDRYGA